MIPDSWHNWFGAQTQLIDARISTHLDQLKAADTGHSPLLSAVEYSLAQPGKRLRPVLVIESCRVCGGDPTAALPVALAVECVHTYSLIHDDLPAMDDDALRRGRPTNHRVFGEAMAILAGDWLAAHACELAADISVHSRAAEAVRTLAAATADMVAGQAADIAAEGKPPSAALVDYVHRNKTGRLIEASCQLGAIAADAPDDAMSALSEYGRHVGRAFQIVDDLLDREGSAEKLGKAVGKDVVVAKPTYPAVAGDEASRLAAKAAVDAAVRALDRFGARADNLRLLARFVLERER